MISVGRRRLFLVSVGAIAAPLTAAALAYGCTAVATLQPSSSVAKAGSTITVTGKYFGTHDPASDNTNGLAEIRLGSLSGPVLATGTPAGPDQAFSVQVTIPASTEAGTTFLAATQQTATGTPVYGTPARQAITVLAASAGGSGGGSANTIDTTAPENVATVLTLAQARRVAKTRLKRRDGSAKRIRVRCSRRSLSSATCRLRWTSKGKRHSKKMVVSAPRAASVW